MFGALTRLPSVAMAACLARSWGSAATGGKWPGLTWSTASTPSQSIKICKTAASRGVHTLGDRCVVAGTQHQPALTGQARTTMSCICDGGCLCWQTTWPFLRIENPGTVCTATHCVALASIRSRDLHGVRPHPNAPCAGLLRGRHCEAPELVLASEPAQHLVQHEALALPCSATD